MKLPLLQRLLEARKRQQSAVLIRNLSDGHQVLIDDLGFFGDASAMPDALLELAKAALHRGGTATQQFEQERYLIQTFSPAPRLVIIGAVHIAQALIPMARIAGYKVSLIDPRSAFASTERFPDTDISHEWPTEAMEALSLNAHTAVVTLSHDAKIDDPALQTALQSDAFYIGALGSKKNHAKRLQRLAEQGFSEATLARIAGPVGLPLGGRSPAEIAVSILAQIIQSRSKQGSLVSSNPG